MGKNAVTVRAWVLRRTVRSQHPLRGVAASTTDTAFTPGQCTRRPSRWLALEIA